MNSALTQELVAGIDAFTADDARDDEPSEQAQQDEAGNAAARQLTSEPARARGDA